MPARSDRRRENNAIFSAMQSDGKSAAAALRDSKLQLMRAKMKIGRREMSLANPFFWAPFVLIEGARRGSGLSDQQR
jgi:CHAT domain-containing protein